MPFQRKVPTSQHHQSFKQFCVKFVQLFIHSVSAYVHGQHCFPHAAPSVTDQMPPGDLSDHCRCPRPPCHRGPCCVPLLWYPPPPPPPLPCPCADPEPRWSRRGCVFAPSRTAAVRSGVVPGVTGPVPASVTPDRTRWMAGWGQRFPAHDRSVVR